MIGVCEQELPRVRVEQVVTRAAVAQGGRVIHAVQRVSRAVVDAKKVEARVQVGGLRGEPGQDGASEGATFTGTAGETIHGRRVVRMAGGLVFHPDVATPAHAGQVVGIATQAAALGAPVVVRTAGTITEASWSWADGFIFCGPDGVLTQSPGPAGWLLVVGRALSPTSIDVDVDTPFMRA